MNKLISGPICIEILIEEIVVNMDIENYKEKFLKRLNEISAEELTAIFKKVFDLEEEYPYKNIDKRNGDR